MRMHKDHGGDKQAEVARRTLLNLTQRTLNKIKASEAEGHSSAVPEGGTSSLAEEAQRKNIHRRLDLNKDAPEDDDEDGGGHNEAA
ncbi:hypothetical protein NL676_006255 [Syzygium grande]|nr:hypothetical protein NL676_006255 [Syzygium grande]